MTCFQLAWRSVIRKPVKNILLLLIICILSLFLLSCLASKNASIKIQDDTRQAIGSGFLLVENEANRHTRINALSEKIGADTEGTLGGYHQEKIELNGETSWRTFTDNSFETLLLSDIKKLSAARGISDYNITTAVTAVNPVNFIRIQDSDMDQSADALGISLIGNRSMAMDSNVLSGNLTLKEGRMATQDDSNVCVISEELADLNSVTVGDTLQFNNYKDREHASVYDAKIIGIYQLKQKMAPYMSGDTYRSENIIFTDLNFPEKAEGCENNPLYEKAYFQVSDSKEYASVKTALQKISINWERYDFIDKNGNYDTMSSNFNDLENISRILVWAAAGTGFIILFFLFLFWLKTRIQEIGIFLALGFSKYKIISQILTEALLITVTALALSFFFAPYTSKLTAHYLVGQQAASASEEKTADSGKVSSAFQESDPKVTGVIVVITTPMLLLDGIGVIVLTIASVSAAGTVILRKKPKDILSQMN